MSAPGPYSIGSEHLPGLSKLIEECGEVVQVAGKILGMGGFGQHFDGTNSKERLQEELGDLLAAISFVEMYCGLDRNALGIREAEKLSKFIGWHKEHEALTGGGRR